MLKMAISKISNALGTHFGIFYWISVNILGFFRICEKILFKLTVCK